MASAMARALLLVALPAVLAGVIQKPLLREDAIQLSQARPSETQSQRKLHGRFLHITDIHPDPFYELYSSTAEGIACHRSTGPAGYYGAETSDCDSPFSLVNATFHWIAQNLADKIDFVVWTGDSARHDNDEHHPRSISSVVSLNRFLVQKFEDVFGVDEKVPGGSGRRYKIPIVPTFGNNDILPHNLFFKGPNKWTKTYGDVWRSFIPEEQRHGFERGGWFYVELIPGKLAVFSLNTMYFFDSNTAVDGCARRTEPGYEHMEWLRIQLQFLRERGVKAIMSGHVPPARNEEKAGWDETCWQKYALWMRQYRDVVVGSLYGHMNIEHFVLQDFADIDLKEMGVESWRDERKPEYSQDSEEVEDGGSDDEEASDDGDNVEVQVKAPNYLTALRDLWARLPVAPKDELSTSLTNHDTVSNSKRRKSRRTALEKYHDKIGGEYAERFAVSHISASVVPNFFSTLRVYEYNITGLGDGVPSDEAAGYSVPAWPERIDDDDEKQGIEEQTTSLPFTPTSIIQNLISRLLRRPNTSLSTTPSSTSHLSPRDHITITKHKKHRRRKHKHKKHKKSSFIVPDPPTKGAPPGPAYSPQPLSWTGYVQYVANNTWLNNDFTSSPSSSSSSSSSSPSSSLAAETNDKDMEVGPLGWNPGRYTDRTPTDHSQERPPRPFEYRIEYNTSETKDDYALGEGLTVRKWVELAARIGEFRGRGERDEEEDDQNNNCDGDCDSDCDSASDSENEETQFNFSSDTSTKKKKKKKHHHNKNKHHKHHKRKIINRDWFAFVSRAVTGTLSDEELHDQFGEEVDVDIGVGIDVDVVGAGDGDEPDNDLVCDAEGSDCHIPIQSEGASTSMGYPIQAQLSPDSSRVTFDRHEQSKLQTHRAEAWARERGRWPYISGEMPDY